MIKILNKILFCFLLMSTSLFGIEDKNNQNSYYDDSDNSSGSLGRIVPNSLPNPMNDRAKGFLLKGKVQSAISNYGNFINWDHHPA